MVYWAPLGLLLTDSVIGLNLVQPEISSEPTSPMEASVTRDLDAELALWTNVQFPEEPYFSPERDTASRSRHKSINPPVVNATGAADPLASGLSFFGNVGAAALHNPAERNTPEANYQSHHDRAKSSQIHPLNELFSWNGNNMDAIFGHSVVDPFLGGMGFNNGATNSEAADNGLHPLTVRDHRGLQARQASQGLNTIDPANTSLTPPAKKARIRKVPSIDTTFTNVNENSFGISYEPVPTSSHASSRSSPTPTATTHNVNHMSVQEAGVSASEDKRRRNTLASARFRLKKKEREAALEKRAKELDDKVTELERECESLRKENQWLKGLVVGATTGENVLLSGSNSNAANSSNSVDANNTADLEEHIRILKANGFVVTTSTGKRKRGAAATSNDA